MARPLKTGIDYFPHTCTTQIEMEILEARCGIVGYAIINKLYERIYASEGYYCKWSDNIEAVFAKRIGTDVECMKNVLEVAFENDIFSKQMFDRYKILTSKEIQAIYIEVTKKRKKVTLIEEFLLIGNCEQIIKDSHNIINDAHNTQSKVEESRENKNKENQSKVEESRENKNKENQSKVEESRENNFSKNVSEIKIPCIDGTYIVKENQIDRLQQIYTEVNVAKSIRRIYDYVSSHTEAQRKVANMENRIRLWLDEDNERASKSSKKDDSNTIVYDKEFIKGIDFF